MYRLPLIVFCLMFSVHSMAQDPGTPEQRFKALALACVHQEYPNKISHVMSSDEDVAPPRALTPVFYGCFDWHSAVHGHWLLVRLLRLHPDDPDSGQVEAALEESFQAEKVAVELAYMQQDTRAGFERPYGVAWLLQLMAEVREWDDPRARRWQSVLQPLEAAYVRRMDDWLSKLAYPIRIGEHAQTAFAFALFLDWARVAGDTDFEARVTERTRSFYLADENCPLSYEPGGQDFLSPCLAEGDLVRRVLPPLEYAAWLRAFLPGIGTDSSADWLPLATVTDRTDGKLAHLDGLHLARAWALNGMASGLPADDERRSSILAAASVQAEAGLAAVSGQHYAGGHWLGSFATYLVTGRGTGVAMKRAKESGPALRALHQHEATLSRLEKQFNIMITSPNDAVATSARALDDEMAAGLRRGPLHGLPVVLKDNIEAREWPTTAGSLALADNETERDAELTRRLRAAGLLITGKANLSEWANFRDESSTSGWSAVGGLTPNPRDATRTACGSSSGSAAAVAAAYAPFAIGTETNGSIICPASHNGVVGIKPTVGLVSRRGIVPIAHSQDTAGPMAYSVKAAAQLLAIMEGEDPGDPATVRARAHFGRDYTENLSTQGLKGLRIGVIRRDFGDGSVAVFDQAVSDLARAGAELVQGLVFPEWPEAFWDESYEVLATEFHHDIDAYLAGLPGQGLPRTLEDLIAFNKEHADLEMPWFGQSIFIDSLEKEGLDNESYRQALANVQGFTRSALDELLQLHDIDLLVMPSNAASFSIDLVHGDRWIGGSSSFAAIAGYPHITVPAGQLKGLPIGLSLVGTAFSEPVLIRAAYAYEQATGHATTLAGADPWLLEDR